MLIEKDIVILGGGIAGLWLLNRLRDAGYSVLLLENSALGAGQTIASQGMIHGGLKYALGGALTGASEAIADMPQHWQRCLQGQGDVDLRGTQLLSDTYYLWPRNSMRSRLTAFLGSKLVSSKATAVEECDVPAFFRGHLDGALYRLHDIVLDVPSLLNTLGQRCREYIHHIAGQSLRFEQDATGQILSLHVGNSLQLKAQRFICTAGEGNADLLRMLQPPALRMQKRPLQMVVVKHHIEQPLYVHCVADQFTATPELTITTHHCRDGALAWYLGGELAEAGANIDQGTQISNARAKLAQLFPWCDFRQAQWRSFYINRAEAQQADGKRPDRDSVLTHSNVLFCWPTKLTLAPALANSVFSTLRAQNVLPRAYSPQAVFNSVYPGIAQPPWEAAWDTPGQAPRQAPREAP
jgi:glycine/D-amino acid oxidase-like deaminating enzyme